jgi:CHAT domain-containing protein
VSLVVADPELPPGIARRERLARLPGASAEGRAVSDALGGRTTTLLRGAAASESRVRGAMAGRRVVHFATHGVIRDDQPMASFLALAGSGSSPDDDGRLTTAEVYELSLKADLVVLSACRSALGPVTGDGITGLTRAFFGAGTRSVIASLWDLPDVVTAPLLSRFYREWERSSSKAAGLRRAQLHMIGQLRAGRMVVDTPAGKFVVPEHPSLWAGLVLVGEPH